MNVFSEKEQVANQQHFVYQLRNLYRKDIQKFQQIVEYLPMFVQINEISSRDIIFNNKNVFGSYKEAENLVEFGFSYLPKIACPLLFDSLQVKHKLFIKKNDDTLLCSYPQKIRLNGDVNLILSNKMLLNPDSYMIVSNLAKDLVGFGAIYEEVFLELTENTNLWLAFMSLTKKEKIILRKLVFGSNNQQISEELFISKHTVITHRKNIYKKLNVSNVIQLVKFAFALDIL